MAKLARPQFYLASKSNFQLKGNSKKYFQKPYHYIPVIFNIFIALKFSHENNRHQQKTKSS